MRRAIVIELISSACLLLAGCAPGLTQRATAEDFTAAVAAEAAMVSFAASSPQPAPDVPPSAPRPGSVSKALPPASDSSVCLPGSSGCATCLAPAVRARTAAPTPAERLAVRRGTSPQRWTRRGWFRRR